METWRHEACGGKGVMRQGVMEAKGGMEVKKGGMLQEAWSVRYGA